ncbi:MAG: tyrosine-type recombinase/integrase [Bacteroidota bacterium]|jgi:site-specific recombinase XerD
MDYRKTIPVVYHSCITWSGKFSYTFKSDRDEILLNEAIDHFLEYHKHSYSQNTIYAYSRDLNFLQNKLGNTLMSSINEEHIHGFLSQFDSSNIKIPYLSAASLNRTKSSYRSFFNWCYTRRYINVDLSKEIRLVKTRSQSTPAISQEEIRILLDTISKSSDKYSQRDKTLFAVLAFSGIRKSEALALRISDYDSLSKTLYLPRTKCGSKKSQPIPLVLSKILDEYISEIPRGNIIEQHSSLFPGLHNNSSLSSRQVSNRFEKWKGITGIRKNLTIHSFRAAYASQLYKITKNPLLVSYALGHSSFNTTKRYISEDIFDFYSVLENSFPRVHI